MNAIVNTGPDRLEWLELPAPEPGSGQVRIRTAYCGICATDLEMIRGWDRTGFPSVPGHEWSGFVDATGDGVDQTLLGLPCVADNILGDGQEVGFEKSGAYARFFLTEATNLHPLPDGLSLDVAALIEPLAVCARGIRRLAPRDRTRALVLGDGPIGLLCVLLLRRSGIDEITLIGGQERRLQIGGKFGATRTLNHRDLNTDTIKTLAGLAPNVVEASGSPQGMETAFRAAARAGKILVIGDYGAATAHFRWNEVPHRELEIIGSNTGAGAWPEALDFASEFRDKLRELITHRFPASEFAGAMELLVHRPHEAGKVMLVWD